MNSAQAGGMGMSTVPLSELYAGAAEFLAQRSSGVQLNANVEKAELDEEMSAMVPRHIGRYSSVGFPVAGIAF